MCVALLMIRRTMQAAKRCWATINLDNISHNYNLFSGLAGKNTSVIAVVKANAYGHGSVQISKHLANIGCKCFAVATVLEAVQLRQAGITQTILILGYTPPEQMPLLTKYNLVQTVYSVEYAQLVSSSTNKKISVHIKLDSGMARLGIKAFDINSTLKQIQQIANMKNLSIEGIYTHLAVSCDTDKNSIDYTLGQLERFSNAVNTVKQAGINVGIVHCSNSAAAINYRDYNFDAVRVGISLYGLSPSNKKISTDIRPVMSFCAVVTQVKTIDSGAYVGYGCTYQANKKIKVATVAIGYADGYPRILSNKGVFSCNGKLVKVIGRVCMDQIMLDVTDVDVSMGDTVTIFGGDSEITCEQYATSYDTINYEAVCDIAQRVSRVFTLNNEIVSISELCEVDIEI